MIADSRFRMTPDLKENNGWPICLIHRNPQAPFCPIMSKLVLELWMCYHLSFLCYMKQRYQILNKTLPLLPSIIPPARGWKRNRSSSCTLTSHSVFITEEAIHLSSEQTFLQWTMDGLRTANRLWRLSLLCWSSEPGPAGETRKGIIVCQPCEIDDGIYSPVHFITPPTFPALSASERTICENLNYFPPVAALFRLRLNCVEQGGCAGLPMLWLCCARRKVGKFHGQFHAHQPWSLQEKLEPKLQNWDSHLTFFHKLEQGTCNSQWLHWYLRGLFSLSL